MTQDILTIVQNDATREALTAEMRRLCLEKADEIDARIKASPLRLTRRELSDAHNEYLSYCDAVTQTFMPMLARVPPERIIIDAGKVAP